MNARIKAQGIIILILVVLSGITFELVIQDVQTKSSVLHNLYNMKLELVKSNDVEDIESLLLQTQTEFNTIAQELRSVDFYFSVIKILCYLNISFVI